MIFDSRNSFYKHPFGAVAIGTDIVFRLVLPVCNYAPQLIIKCDDEQDIYLDFERVSTDDGFNTWRCVWCPERKGIYFYSFNTLTDNGVERLFKSADSSHAVFDKTVRYFQQTVYDAAVLSYCKATADKYSGGIMYQIFPDRFCFSGRKKKHNFDDRITRSWDERLPFYGDEQSSNIINTDYWQGDFKGIESKLSYLSELGVTLVYLNPIFEAHSNHRYNTADYEKTDPMLGTQEEFSQLCSAAKKYGIDIILDGVFSHTGADSKYFNLYGRYGDGGAAKDKDSAYYGWYDFENWPDKYSAWWGVKSLPQVNEDNEDYLEYITGEGGIVSKWMSLGAAGWRLDVADELPDVFLDRFTQSVKSHSNTAPVFGEVWEDASNKISYSKRRRYLLGGQLDSVMNYPFRDAVLTFLRGGNAERLAESVMIILENYPKPSVDMLMNILSTHDTERILTALCVRNIGALPRDKQAQLSFDEATVSKASRFQRIAAALQFTLPGIPCIYYGDETGCAFGGCDPFNRAPFDWDNAHSQTITFYKKLSEIRKGNSAFAGGELKILYAHFGLFVFERIKGENRVLVAVNRWCDAEIFKLPYEYRTGEVYFGSVNEHGELFVPVEGIAIVSKEERK